MERDIITLSHVIRSKFNKPCLATSARCKAWHWEKRRLILHPLNSAKIEFKVVICPQSDTKLKRMPLFRHLCQQKGRAKLTQTFCRKKSLNCNLRLLPLTKLLLRRQLDASWDWISTKKQLSKSSSFIHSKDDASRRTQWILKIIEKLSTLMHQ